MSHRHQAQEEDDEADSRVTISLRAGVLRYLVSGLLAVAGGAGGGYGAQRLQPPETHRAPPERTAEQANEAVQTQLRMQRVEDRTAVLERDRDKHEVRLDKLEDRVRPASYSR